MPKSKSGKNKPDPAKTAADAAYIARAARVMRWVMRFAIAATVATLFFIVEPVARMAINGDLGRSLEQKVEHRKQMVSEGRTPGPIIEPEWGHWGLTAGGGVAMLILFAGLLRALKRLEQAGQAGQAGPR